MISNLWEALKQFVVALFQPFLWLVTGFTYLLSKCFDIVVLVIQILFGLFKLVGSVIAGVFNTFGQLLGFSGSTQYYYMPGAYQGGWNAVGDFLNQTGFNTIAVIMAVFIWLMTAYAIIKIAGGDK
ncbi:hypothetical protein [Moorella sp. ACPs]|uniref:hypothetical protein n=1 Tax=Neomoorella carbonis TaxID=3062783 RepID=UPI003873BB4E